MKFKIILLSIIALSLPIIAMASDKPVNVYLFWAQGCPHCIKEKEFLEKIEKKHRNVKIYKFEIGENNNAKIIL